MRKVRETDRESGRARSSKDDSKNNQKIKDSE